jgi:L-ectoine synthase
MIVRTLEEVIGTEREVAAQTWTSRRLLLKEDGMGFSLHETIVRAGTETAMWYKNHVEAVYCIEGRGEVEVVRSGAVHPIAPGTVYALDQHERHLLRARTTLRLVCVFNPPCTGREVHDADGTYPLAGEPAPAGAGKEQVP